MIVLRELRRRARFILGPFLGMALTGYFAYNLCEGDRGLLAWLRLTREIHAADAHLDAVKAERAAIDRRVADMKPDHLDPDLLDERVRAGLNLVGPNEVVIMKPPPKQ
jgi:cell division protein FtsB